MSNDTKAKARALRAQGLTIQEIADELGIKKHSVWYHVQDMPLPERVHKLRSAGRSHEAMADMRAVANANYARKRAEADAEAEAVAREVLGDVDDRLLQVAGAIAYWCEGSKSKPWRRLGKVVYTNSDPMMIWLFLAFVASAPVERGPVGFRVAIHESADEASARSYWGAIVGADAATFRPSTIKRHKPRTNRKNVGADYHGCLVIDVRQGAALYRYIEALARLAVGRWASGLLAS
ncbi:MAG TPA: hypothetical protein VHE83_13690 [Mycobacteriales bacterium]|nr:hypothetical protein [Mycobacteriales bacterium]